MSSPISRHGSHHLAEGRVAHSTRGRVRLQFPKQDTPHLESISVHLRTMPGVRSVEVRPATGSVIVHHTADIPDLVPSLRSFVGDAGLFLIEGREDAKAGAEHLTAVERDAHYLIEHSRLGKRVLQYAEHLNRAVKRSTEGWVDLRVLLPASVAVVALLVVNVESSPMWLPLVLFSYQSFSNLHQPAAVAPSAPALLAPEPLTLEGN